MTAHPGIILAVIATVVYNIGFIAEKRALDRLPRIEAHRVWRLIRTLFTARAWLAGFALICCGLVLQVVVLSLEPLTVSQPLQACGVVVTILFSWLVLRERLGRSEFACVAVIAVAVLLLALSTGHGAGTGPGAGPGTHASGGAIAMAAVLVALVIAAGYGWMSRKAGNAQATSVGYGFCAGLAYGYAGLAMKALSAAVFAPRRQNIGSGAIADARARAASDLAAAVTSPYLYVLLAAIAVGMCLFQVALQRGRASIVMPVSLVMSIGYLVVVGSWLFHERLPDSPVALAMRLAGGLAAVTVPVILAVASQRRAAPGPETAHAKGGAAPARPATMAGEADITRVPRLR